MKAVAWTFLLAAVTTAGAAPLPIADVERTQPVDFASEIYPALKQNCLACHNTTKAKANLNLESSALMQKGGDSGPALVPGKAAESLLLKSAAHLDEDLIMPPPGNKANALALAPEQLGLLRLWIDQGAKGESVADARGPLPWRSRTAAGPVQAVAISPDGRLAAAARSNRVELCELGTGRVLSALRDPALSELAPWKGDAVADRDAVMAVAFGSDDLLATGGFRTVRFWRRMPRKVLRDFGALAEAATVLAVSPDGHWAAAGDGKGAVWLWAFDTEKFEPAALREHAAPISALCFSADGALLSCAEDRSVRVWSVASRAAVWKGNAPSAIHALTLLEGGQEMLAGCADGVARVWPWLPEAPAQFPAATREFKLQDASLRAFAAAVGGTFLWVAADGSVRTSSVSDGKEQTKIAPEHPAAVRVALLEREAQVAQGLVATRKALLATAAEKAKKESDGARTAAQASEQARAEARRKRDEAGTATEAQRANPGDKPLEDAAKKAAEAAEKADAAQRGAKGNATLGARLAGEAAAAQATAESALAGADAAVPGTQAALDAAKKIAAEPLQLVPRNGTAIVAHVDGRMRQIACESGALLEPPDVAGVVALTPAGELLCVGTDTRVRLTSLRREWALERVIGDADDPALLADRVMSLAFSPDGKLLVTGGGTPSREGELKLWRVADGTLLRTIGKAHADTVNSVAFSPDGELLATVAGDRSARIWSVADGSRIALLEGHTGPVLSTGWRADGLALASGGADRSVRLWDLATRRQTRNINTFGGEVAAVSFVGPGEMLLTACGDKLARIDDKPLPDSAAFPFCAAADPGGRFVAVGGQDGVLRIWTVADRKLVRTFAPASP